MSQSPTQGLTFYFQSNEGVRLPDTAEFVGSHLTNSNQLLYIFTVLRGECGRRNLGSHAFIRFCFVF